MNSIESDIYCLCVYMSSQTYTETVYEHLDSFQKYSKYSWNYIDINDFEENIFSIEKYKILVIHYSVRLPFDQISAKALKKIQSFNSLKVLFIQDEYDHTNKAKKLIKKMSIDLIFTTVPKKSIELIYPKIEFPDSKFINNLTGYVPDEIEKHFEKQVIQIKKNLISYRGRILPLRYGMLGFEKKNIGLVVKNYCKDHNLHHDIEVRDKKRIYGSNWYKFISNSRAMLGTESGCNIFDWDGNLQEKINSIKQNKKFNDSKIYNMYLKNLEVDGLMNQISPRIFEMAASRTLMILFEGSYSGIVKPYKHYLPLKKDYSNLDEIIQLTLDDDLVNDITENAFNDLVSSGKYSYENFIKKVDFEFASLLQEKYKFNLISKNKSIILQYHEIFNRYSITTKPLKNNLVSSKSFFLSTIWKYLPVTLKLLIKKIILRNQKELIKYNFFLTKLWLFIPYNLRQIIKIIIKRK